MKRIFPPQLIFFLLTFSCVITSDISSAQTCGAPLTLFPPINDLSTGYFSGYQGGLYPGGQNSRPVAHNNAGKTIANNVVPLDASGSVNLATGKIVMVSIGMSNTALEFTTWIPIANGSVLKNPKTVLINCAQGGMTIDSVLNPSSDYWPTVNSLLAAHGVTMNQVQVVWFKEAEKSPTLSSFPAYPVNLKNKFKSAMPVLKTNFPNVKLCYLASRIYAGYASVTLNPEPYAYYSGWSVKWLIEDQLAGDPSLAYSGSSPVSPWLSWGPYLWADGYSPRIDGLKWDCPSDFIGDGTHPSAAGSNKVAMLLNNFFHNDQTTKPWFLKNMIIHSTLSIEGFFHGPTSMLRMSDTVTLYLRSSSAPFQRVDSCTSVIDSATFRGAYNFYNADSGSYYLQIKHRNSIETWSRAGGELLMPGGYYQYNFTNSQNKAYGNNLVFTGNRFSIYSGDVDQNGVINLNDMIAAYNDASQFLTGYKNTDVTGDNITNLEDIILIFNNSAKFIGRITP